MAMFTRTALGIVFTPSWIRAARVELASGRCVDFGTFAVPLPAGCINEDSGAVESSGALSSALRTVIHSNGFWRKQAEIFLVVPHRLCYRTAFVVPARLQGATKQQLIDECCSDLPGEREKLVVDIHVHSDSVTEPRSAMVLAVRQASVEPFVSLFGDTKWRIQGITTGEIARFNRWQSQRGDLEGRCVLVCSADSDSRELSVWDRGVLVASDTSFAHPRMTRHQPPHTRDSVVGEESPDVITRDIENVINSQRRLGRPIEAVLFGGALRNHECVQEQVRRSTALLCEASKNMSVLVVASSFESATRDDQSGQGEEGGFFDDAIGAIAARLPASLNERQSSQVYG